MSSPSRTVLDRMAKMTSQVASADRAGVRAAALAVKNAQLAELDKVTTNRTLRRVGKKGAKLGVSFKVEGGDKNPSAFVKATGPWHFIEGTSDPHVIYPKPARRGGKKALKTPFGPRASVKHPGVKHPKKPWAKAKPKAADAARRAMNARYVEAFRKGAR